MKKDWITVIGLCAALALTLCACSGGGASSSTTSSSKPESQSEKTSSSEPASSEAGESESVSAAAFANADLADRLTPPDAENVVHEANTIVFTSPSSVDDIRAFYEAALTDLGAQGESEATVTGWAYTGTYDGGKPITIAVTLLSGVNAVTVAY